MNTKEVNELKIRGGENFFDKCRWIFLENFWVKSNHNFLFIFNKYFRLIPINLLLEQSNPKQNCSLCLGCNKNPNFSVSTIRKIQENSKFTLSWIKISIRSFLLYQCHKGILNWKYGVWRFYYLDQISQNLFLNLKRLCLSTLIVDAL